MTDKTPYIVAAGPSTTNIIDVVGSFFHDNFFGASLEVAMNAKVFVAFVPAISTYAFLPDFKAPFNPESHIFDLIDLRILKAAADGRCLIVFDTSSEGDPLVQAAYANLHDWLGSHGVPTSAVIIVNQNRNYGGLYRAAFGDGIRFLVHDSYIKRILRIAGAADSDAELGLGRSQIGYRGYDPNKPTFLSLNGAPRPNRIVAVAGLHGTGLLDHTVWSMLGDRSGKLLPSYNDARIFRSRIGLEWITDAMIETVMAQMPKFIQAERQAMMQVTGSDALALKINLDLFDLAFCSIATETEFTDGTVRRISELSLKPMMIGHPMVSIGNPGSLQLLRDIGFSTFSPSIDETYDTISDPGERLESVYRALRSLQACLRSSDGWRVDAELKEICEHNIRFAAYSAIATYERVVERDMIEGLIAGCARLSAH